MLLCTFRNPVNLKSIHLEKLSPGPRIIADWTQIPGNFNTQYSPQIGKPRGLGTGRCLEAKNRSEKMVERQVGTSTAQHSSDNALG